MASGYCTEFGSLASSHSWLSQVPLFDESISRTLLIDNGLHKPQWQKWSTQKYNLYWYQYSLVWTSPLWIHFPTLLNLITNISFEDFHPYREVEGLHSFGRSASVLSLLLFGGCFNFLFPLHSKSRNISTDCTLMTRLTELLKYWFPFAVDIYNVWYKNGWKNDPM